VSISVVSVQSFSNLCPIVPARRDSHQFLYLDPTRSAGILVTKTPATVPINDGAERTETAMLLLDLELLSLTGGRMPQCGTST
jgi:hypothetical protein